MVTWARDLGHSAHHLYSYGWGSSGVSPYSITPHSISWSVSETMPALAEPYPTCSGIWSVPSFAPPTVPYSISVLAHATEVHALLWSMLWCYDPFSWFGQLWALLTGRQQCLLTYTLGLETWRYAIQPWTRTRMLAIALFGNAPAEWVLTFHFFNTPNWRWGVLGTRLCTWW